MLSSIVGPVDAYSAFVLCILSICVATVIVSVIAKYQTRQRTDQQYAIDRMRLEIADQENARNIAMSEKVQLAQIASKQVIEIRRLEGNVLEAVN